MKTHPAYFGPSKSRKCITLQKCELRIPFHVDFKRLMTTRAWQAT